jgi:catechol 2,3-dioxygenase-like lactoylglutathione lyase family enzyme
MEVGAMEVQALRVHVALNVRDLAKSIEFYRNLFDVEPSKVRIGYAKFDLTNPPLNFSLNEHALHESGALSHMGIEVASTEAVLAIRKQWHERGLITRDEMQTDCCFATQDKTWILDRDGNEWEVFVVLEDNLPEKAAASATACSLPDSEDATRREEPTRCDCSTH